MNSIKQKILFGGGIALLIVSISLIAYAGTSAYNTALENAKTEVEKNATEQAVLLKTEFEAPLGDSRTLANAFTGVRAAHGEISRDNAANMIQPIIAKNKIYLSGGTVWEPNTYTEAGDDARYAGKEGYESNGRMRVMWLRDSSGLVQRKMYDSTQSTEPGDYYYLTKERMKEVITEPATNPAIGRTEPYISFTAPIIVNKTFMGIVITDISTKTLKDLIDKINLYDDQAIVLLLSDKGQIVATQKKNEQWIGKSWNNANITFIDPSKVSAAEKAYHSGITTTTEGNGYVKSLVPFTIGDTGSYWAVIVAVPTSVITAQAFQTVMNLIIVGIIMSLLGIVILYTVARSISAPIVEVAEISKKMAHGDVDLEIAYTSQDEIGRLADSFRQMIENFKAKTEISTALSNGNLDVVVPIASEEDKLGQAMSQMKEVIGSMVETLQSVASAAERGQLQERGKADKFRGEYRKIIASLNTTLDSVINPVTEAMRLSTTYAQGDYTERFNENISVAGDFIPFKEALNQIGISGSEAIGGVKDEIFALTAGMEETNATVEEVASTASTLAQSSNSVSVIAEKSGQGIKKTLDAMDELVSTMSDVSIKTEDVSAKAKQTVDLSQQGASLAGNAEKGMQAIMVSVSGTSEIITDITGQMDEIGKIVDVITGIAEQTGLLALNAAIEAARAGEAGMGFAVVADEVKTLALESQKSAENIASIIESLQKKSLQVAKSMDSSASDVKSGNQAVGETLAVFNQIVEAVNTVHTNMKEVAEATERQADFVREITTNVNEVGTLVQQTAKEAVDSAAATEEVAASIDQITRTISDAAAAVQRISDEMNKFVTS